MELERQVQERIAQLQQALDFEVRLKRITEQIRNTLDESQILQVVVQELTLVLGTISCHTASYNLGSATSTVRYQYTISEHEIIVLSLPSVGQVVFMNAFPEVYRQLLQGEHFQFEQLQLKLLPQLEASLFVTPVKPHQKGIPKIQLLLLKILQVIAPLERSLFCEFL
jgi:GAF domain-containing protein